QPDPYYAVEDGWVVRRLSPHCGRIGVAQFPKRYDERLILRDMGQETANMHLATPDQKAKVPSDLSARKRDWLFDAAQAMAHATREDWQSFRSSKLAEGTKYQGALSVDRDLSICLDLADLHDDWRVMMRGDRTEGIAFHFDLLADELLQALRD